MNNNVIALAILSALGSPISYANEPVDLGDIEISDGNSSNDNLVNADTIYESYDPVDSGTSVMSETSVQNNKPGGSDTTDLLKSSPFIQMDNSLDDATQENVQSIRPQDFSISGGNYYDNNIQVDGVSATSIHDVTAPSGDLDWNNVVGQTSQTLYVSPDLIGSVEIMDSNISAEYGDFVGGVVNYKIRKPKKEFGFNLSTSFQNDSMVEYHDPTESDSDKTVIPPPEFTKQKTSLSFDLPLTEKLSVLASYSLSQSSVEYTQDKDYGGTTGNNGDTSKNFLLKGLYEYKDNLTFEGQVIHSPYESERDQAKARNDLMISKSSGTQGYLSATGFFGETDWNSKLSVMHNDASRESSNERYQLRGEFLDWCTATNCNDGGIGDLDQTQTDYTWTTSFSTGLNSGTLSYGSEFKYTDATKSRPEDTHYFYSAQKAKTDNYICAPNDKSCTPDMANKRRLTYSAFDADVGVYSHAFWGEYLTQLGPVEMRVGTRYSYDDFSGNHNFAPRLTASWELIEETYLTLGANRYYANKMIGYAIQEQTPAYTCYQRDLKNGSDSNYGGAPGEWYECSNQPSVKQYSNSDLDTPYSDELTAVITIPTFLDGHARFKTVYRQNRDQFARSEELTNANGDDYYEMTNNGSTDYEGYSIEWSGHYKKHFFNANVTWSETKNNGLIDYSTDPEDEAELVYYKGQIMTMSDMYEDDARQNYAAPFRASVSWSTLWFDDALMTSATVYHRGKYEYLTDTRANYVDADGNKYDIYGEQEKKAKTTVDLNATYRFLKYKQHNASIDLRIKNLLDNVEGSESNYQIGRSFWLGLNYSM
ncbi:TonB-dependent receptor plug domain-containing protein [Agarivorans sp. Z349TD_8]|uniref:TonB-dependent receptor plug domain-containing protein n=1 Tax=Agarivorans sp. Z349TD_8 TaxID=3421434 RepID=UPI003D7ECB4F